MNELWIKIIDFPDYEISNFGRVRSYKYPGIPRILKTRPNNGGYLGLKLRHNNKGKDCDIHVLVAKHFLINDIFYGAEVNHKDGNKTNNSITNLEWVSRSRNIKHSFEIGLRKTGENHHSATISDQKCIEIINAYNLGKNQYEISREYNISQSYISALLNNKRRNKNINVVIRKSGLCGEKHNKAKINNDQAKEIKYSKEPTQVLSERYNISGQTVQRIRSGRSWRHIK